MFFFCVYCFLRFPFTWRRQQRRTQNSCVSFKVRERPDFFLPTGLSWAKEWHQTTNITWGEIKKSTQGLFISLSPLQRRSMLVRRKREGSGGGGGGNLDFDMLVSLTDTGLLLAYLIRLCAIIIPTTPSRGLLIALQRRGKKERNQREQSNASVIGSLRRGGQCDRGFSGNIL